MQDRANESSARLAANYDAISSAFKKLIVSVQFHDITRQQVEHVIQALGRLRIDIENNDGSTLPDGRAIAAVLALQSSQLADAGDKFAASVASVAQSLDDVASNVVQMAEETQTLSGHSKGETDSFFLQLEQGCNVLLVGLVHSTEAEIATQHASESLSKTFERMRGPIQQIQEIEIQMHRMALNARIRAAQIGAAGRAIDVLAGAVQKLAFECRERSELLVETLGSVSRAGAHSAARIEPGSVSMPADHTAAADEMRAAIAELHSSSERSYTLITEVFDRGDHLEQDLAATRRDFTVGSLFAHGVSAARGALKEIQQDILSDWTSHGIDSMEPDLADLAKHYTMQAERDVHDGVTVAALPASVRATSETPDSPAGEAGEMGDNVEFF